MTTILKGINEIENTRKWKQINYVLLVVFWVTSIMFSYVELLPFYQQEGAVTFWKFIVAISIFIIFFYATIFTIYAILEIKSGEKKQIKFYVKGYLICLISPIFAIPGLVIAFDVSLGMLILILMLLSLILQRLDWIKVDQWIEDLMEAFIPHFKAGIESFIRKREDRYKQ